MPKYLVDLRARAHNAGGSGIYEPLTYEVEAANPTAAEDAASALAHEAVVGDDPDLSSDVHFIRTELVDG